MLTLRATPRPGATPPRVRRPSPIEAAMGDPLAMDILRLQLAAGAGPVDLHRLSPRCRRAVAVADAVGAPLLEAVEGAAAAEEDHRRADRAVTVASSQTRAVAAGLLIAPVLLVPGLARLVGADLVGFYSSAIGVMVLAVGLSLLLVGAVIIRLLVRRVGRAGGDPVRRRGRVGAAVAAVTALAAWRVLGPAVAPLAGLLAHHLVTRGGGEPEPTDDLEEAVDLAATAIAGGVTTAHALRIAADHLGSVAVPLRRLAFDLEFRNGSSVLDGHPVTAVSSAAQGLASGAPEARTAAPLIRVRTVLATATEMGAPAVPTLRRLAADLRADDLARVLAAAERLPAQLTFPTALCLLPATVLLVGAPIVHAGLLATGTSI